VDNILENAFSFSDTSEKRLNIFLTACHLKSDSFSVGAFSHFKRTTRIYLDAWLNESNNITFLDQRIFELFSMPIIGTKFKLQILIAMIVVLIGLLKTLYLANN
jgi:hypothetical protein